MYALATQVTGWLADGREVVIGRVVDTQGFSSRQPAAAFAMTQGEPIAGGLASGAADRRLTELLAAGAFREPGLVEVAISDSDAASAGLSCGGTVRILAQPAADLDARLWLLLAAEQPCAVVSTVEPGMPTEVLTPEEITDPEVAQQSSRGASATSLVADRRGDKVVTVLWPTPQLVVLGSGSIAEALSSLADLLGWRCQVTDSAMAATDAAALRRGDGIVVLSHDVEVAGPVLAAALRSPVSYVGALGSRRTQSVRREWLIGAGLDAADVGRIHGPAGLDIGALTPGEIAIAITAEMLAVRTGSDAASLSGRTTPIHR